MGLFEEYYYTFTSLDFLEVGKYKRRFNYEFEEIKNRVEGKKQRVNQSYLKSKEATAFIIINAHTKTNPELAKALGFSQSQISRRLKELKIVKKRIYSPVQNHIQETCLMVNIETGIFYPNQSEAARSVNINIRTLQWNIKKQGYYRQLIKVA